MLFDISYKGKFPFIHITKESLFGVFFEFVIVGILGFIMETVLEYITAAKFVDRGFLCGPFIPIYGVFILFICLINKFPKRNLKNYLFLSAVILVLSYIFEEIIGTSCEAIFHTKLWQYSLWLPLNSISRYTNLFVSFAWGFLGSFYYLFIIPLVYKLSKKISNRIKIALSIEFITIFIADIIYTLVRIDRYGGYKKLYDYPREAVMTLFMIGIFAYLIAVILFTYSISKRICKLNKKLDFICFILSTFMILLPFFSAYDYLERSGIHFFEGLSALGFIDCAIMIYLLFALVIGYLTLGLYKLTIYLIEKKKTVNDKIKIYKHKFFDPFFMLGALVIAIAIVFVGFISVKNPTTTKISVGSGDKSLKIVAVSDIHYGTTGCVVDLADLVEDINSQNPDLVLFLGDTIDKYATESSANGKEYLDYNVFAKYMREIKSTYGIYDISGNHEFETNSLFEANSFFRNVEILAPNFNYLDDQAKCIADSLILVGRRDYYFGGKYKTRNSIESILDQANLLDSNLDIIVLDHQPQDYRDSMNQGAILQLSGHTHDGQIFPGNIIVSLLHKIKYGCISYGLYHENDFSLFVTRGYGAWGFPLRTTGASEILIVDYKYN